MPEFQTKRPEATYDCAVVSEGFSTKRATRWMGGEPAGVASASPHST
jgi:hypothetical protein